MLNFHFKIKLFLKNKSLILALMYQRTRKTKETKRNHDKTKKFLRRTSKDVRIII